MKNYWFKPWGWIYQPITAAGWVVTILALLFFVHVFLVIDARSHSASDTLYGVFPWAALLFLLWIWVAGKTSR